MLNAACIIFCKIKCINEAENPLEQLFIDNNILTGLPGTNGRTGATGFAGTPGSNGSPGRTGSTGSPGQAGTI